MKILKSFQISPFGSLNFVLEEFEKQKTGILLEKHFPVLASQCKYTWKDILYSFRYTKGLTLHTYGRLAASFIALIF